MLKYRPFCKNIDTLRLTPPSVLPAFREFIFGISVFYLINHIVESYIELHRKIVDGCVAAYSLHCTASNSNWMNTSTKVWGAYAEYAKEAITPLLLHYHQKENS